VFASLLTAAGLFGPAELPAPAVAGPGEPRYYFILYGGQSIPFRPRTAHTWATFAKATPMVNGEMAVESLTISWLPADGPVRPLALRSEIGKNYSLEETFAIAERNRDRVSMWGPYEIDAHRYELAVEQAARLESGAVRYRVLDTLGFKHSISHCVHAVTYADPVLRRAVQPVLQVGEPGTSRLAARYLRNGAFVGGAVTHDWLVAALGLDRYAVVRREPGEWIRRRLVR
jgi:hypothetical protein